MDLYNHDVFYRIWIFTIDDMKYSIGLMEENDSDCDKLYTFSVFKRIFSGICGFLYFPTLVTIKKTVRIFTKIEKCNGEIINLYNVIRWKEDILWNM